MALCKSFALTDTGKEIASVGKWKEWYRGEKKINFPEVREKLSDAIKRIEKSEEVKK